MFHPLVHLFDAMGCVPLLCARQLPLDPEIIFFFYPETAGRRLEEMDLIFAKAHIEASRRTASRSRCPNSNLPRSSRRLQRSSVRGVWRNPEASASTSPGRISDSSAEAEVVDVARTGEAPVAHPLLWQSQVKSRVEFTGATQLFTWLPTKLDLIFVARLRVSV